MTKRQSEIFTYIKDFILENRYPPTVREIGGYFSISGKAAFDHLKALEKKGLLNCSNNRSRAIELCSGIEEMESVRIPLLGNVAAGRPLLAEEDNGESVYVPGGYLRKGKHFALYVKGDSMEDAGILDGDLAVCLLQQTAENGQIIVAMTEDGVTLKRFYKEKSRIRLQAENPRYPAIYTSDVRILGRLITVIRNYE